MKHRNFYLWCHFYTNPPKIQYSETTLTCLLKFCGLAIWAGLISALCGLAGFTHVFVAIGRSAGEQLVPNGLTHMSSN